MSTRIMSELFEKRNFKLQSSLTDRFFRSIQ